MEARRPHTPAAQGSRHRPRTRYVRTSRPTVRTLRGCRPGAHGSGRQPVSKRTISPVTAVSIAIAPVLLVAAAFLFTAAACSREVRHRVLTFFYDGVPSLNAGLAEPDAGMTESSEVTAEGEPGARAKKGKKFYNHPAYWKNLCGGCHEGDGGGLLKTVREGLCQTCHPDNPPRKKFVHGPVAVNGCLACHLYHRSEYPKVLVTDAQSLCYQCHVEEELITDKE